MIEVFREFRFEAAHFLPHVPDGHPCGRMHGHSYRVVVRLRGELDPKLGWVRDFADVEHAFEPLRRRLDHHVLNEIDGLENSTAEVLATWLWDRLAPELPELAEVTVHETLDTGVTYRGA